MTEKKKTKTPKKSKTKKPAAQKGRPSKYYKKYCKSLISFFSIDACRTVKDFTTYKDGTTVEKEREIANCVPFFSAWCRSINIHRDTMHEWIKKHKDFSDAYITAKEIQKEILIENGLKGLYNARFAEFTAKNITDMRDNPEQKQIEETGNPDRKKLEKFAAENGLSLDEFCNREGINLDDFDEE